ncbi:MAG: hypothetical protein ACRDBO_16370 [Lachnospiraceae bacterium]
MVSTKKTGKIIPTNLADILLLVGVYTELRPILVDKCLNFDRGLLFLFDTPQDFEYLSRLLTETPSVIRIRKTEHRATLKSNNMAALYVYKKSDTLKSIEDFLACDGCLPLLLSCNYIVQSLTAHCYAIHICTDDIRSLNAVALNEEIVNVKDFIRQNIVVILHELSLLNTSADFQMDAENFSFLTVGLLAALTAYRCYFRSQNTEEKTVNMQCRLKNLILHLTNQAELLIEHNDLSDSIRGLIIKNFIDNDHIKIYCVDSIEMSLESAIKNNEVILFDTDFYYITEKLFKSLCSSILDTISILAVKYHLAAADIILCNDTQNNNYTIKKAFSYTNNDSDRIRCLKFRKHYFMDKNGLTLEHLERRKRPCISAIYKPQ